MKPQVIHLRDPNTPAIQYKTLCGQFVVHTAPNEKWTAVASDVTCERCNVLIVESLLSRLADTDLSAEEVAEGVRKARERP